MQLVASSGQKIEWTNTEANRYQYLHIQRIYSFFGMKLLGN
jgi:hypothetical protein